MLSHIHKYSLLSARSIGEMIWRVNKILTVFEKKILSRKFLTT
jgi:hypothetical protein